MADIHIADNNNDDIVRPFITFSPSLWADRFSSLVVIDDETIDKWLKEVEELKAEMRRRLTNLRRTAAVEEKLAFIDNLQRLGIAYLFQNEIEEELEMIFVSSSQTETEMIDKQNLSLVSLYFRMLRQQGFHVSPNIFDGFKDEDGFKSLLRTDVMGLLNLYETAHIRIYGEDILEEAIEFASTNLELMIPFLTPSLSKRVSHALKQPFCRGLPRVEAHFFISLYEEEESNNDLVHRLAKLDYNLLQILHRKELANLSSWWNDVVPKYPFTRDRLVESYFWALGLYYEPQFSIARVMAARTICMLTVLDDAYDAYGTVDELKVFTEAVQRWDISEIDKLPESMKALYEGLLQLYVSYEEDLQKLGRSFALTYAKQRMKKQLQSNYIEAKWFLEGKIPSFDEYIKHASITFGCITTTTTALLGLESVTDESFEWLKTTPPILNACSTMCRLLNDVTNCEVEKERGQLTTGIDYYMNQYGVTIEEAKDGMEKYIENAWKDIYEGWLEPNAAPYNIILMIILNLARLGELTYKHKYDGFSNPEGMKPHILAMLVDPFEI